MVKKTAKTRVVVYAGVALRELLSIEERQNDDLLIFLKKSINYEERGKTNIRLKQDKISVHCSKNSLENGVTITQEIILANQRSAKSHALIKDSNNRLLWIIRAWSCANLNSAQYDVTQNNLDRLIGLKRYRPDFQTPVMAIVVSRPGQILPENSAAINVKSITFRNFTISIYYTFLFSPSVDGGDLALIGTRSPLIDGVPTDQVERLSISSVEDGDLIPMIYGCFGGLRDRLIDRYRRLGLWTKQLQWAIDTSHVSSPVPVQSVAEHQTRIQQNLAYIPKYRDPHGTLNLHDPL